MMEMHFHHANSASSCWKRSQWLLYQKWHLTLDFKKHFLSSPVKYLTKQSFGNFDWTTLLKSSACSSITSKIEMASLNVLHTQGDTKCARTWKKLPKEAGPFPISSSYSLSDTSSKTAARAFLGRLATLGNLVHELHALKQEICFEERTSWPSSFCRSGGFLDQANGNLVKSQAVY